ncbi:hypothetical protein L2E82_09963 [Cichorium intybus]|uniref:Uncharacterized protein n=1 Tax=Cichorium intybus TaxID=13427 RepID=A0ACB9GA31_CICIN|nr:hypothetical protein L2E82_09963 [Cichorium intybus]
MDPRISDTFVEGHEGEEEEWEEGEINREDETHEVSKVPDSGNLGDNFEGDRVEDEGHEEVSRHNLDPTKNGDLFEANNENVEVVFIPKDAQLEEDRELQNIELQNITGGSNSFPGRKQHSYDNVMESERIKCPHAHSCKFAAVDGREYVGAIEMSNQGGGSDTEGRSKHDNFGETRPIIDLDGADSYHSIDLNSEPTERYDWYDLIDEDLLRRGKSKKSKNKDKRSKKHAIVKSSTFPTTTKPKDILKVNAYRKKKKAESSHKNQSSLNKSENSLTISEEIIKTKNVGSELPSTAALHSGVVVKKQPKTANKSSVTISLTCIIPYVSLACFPPFPSTYSDVACACGCHTFDSIADSAPVLSTCHLKDEAV